MTTARPDFPYRKQYASWAPQRRGIITATEVQANSEKFEIEGADAADWKAAPLGGWSKRVLDIAIALPALIVFLPLMAIIAALIKITMGGPVIYAHTRVGYNGATFRCLKFRTMVSNPDEALAQYLASNADGAKEWRERQKLKNDPRVTKLGRILRRTSLDELPQLFNILRGDMSCVGPRPIVKMEIQRYGARAKFYFRARPGLTGLWQVSGRSKLTYDERVTLDCEYVRNWSLALDLLVLIRTLPAVIAIENAA